MSKAPEQKPLFEVAPSPRQVERPVAAEDPTAGIRLKRAQRHQQSVVVQDLDALLEPEHPARAVWQVASKLDLSKLYSQVSSRGSNAGAPAIDPLITLVLWIHATSEGIGSAREIAELCERHDAYRWICGGVSVKAHHLSDFRSQNGKVFYGLITQVVAPLLKHGLCDLTRIAQDGTRVRASAGAASFRKGETLERLQQEAKRHLRAVLEAADDKKRSAVRKAAQERGAKERLARIEQAIAELQDVEEVRARSQSEELARVSTTDPQSRVMKMPDGTRPTSHVA